MKIQLMFRGVNAAKAINQFEGYLPELLQAKEIAGLIKLMQGHAIADQAIKQKLLQHHIIIERNGQVFSCIPVLTAQYSEQIEQQVQKVATKVAEQTEGIIPILAKKLPEHWDKVGHVFMGQVVIGSLWYKLWQDISVDKDAPTATLIADTAITHMFYEGVYPLTSNEAISYWQSALLGNPNRVYDILHHKEVIPTLQSINERYEVIPINNALPLMLPLKMYKTRRGENGMPVQYIDLPRIDLTQIQHVRLELKQLCRCFYQASAQLEAISQICFEHRPQVFQAVTYHDFRQIIYLVFSYVVVEHWLTHHQLPAIVPIKGMNKKDTNISVSLKL